MHNKASDTKQSSADLLQSKAKILFLLLIVVGQMNARADDPAAHEKVLGLWVSPKSIFEVFRKGDSLGGRVLALQNPNYLPDEGQHRAGQPRLDDNNPDENLRTRQIIGLELFTEYRLENDLWQGVIYDPESGNTYQSRVKVNRKGQLEIRGYIGMPMFGRTAVYEPADRCEPYMQVMLAQLPDGSLCSTGEN